MKKYQSYSFSYDSKTFLQQDLYKYEQSTPNLDFYTGKSKITYQNLSINDIHQKKKRDYQWLEQCHDYIQWLFPNFYQSKFNFYSFPLTLKQSQIFQDDKIIGAKVLQSFEIYCNFIGIKIELEQREFKIINDRRLINALLINTHNHLRIKRILNCLSTIGFSLVAKWFVQILSKAIQINQQIRKQQYLMSSLKNDWKQSLSRKSSLNSSQIKMNPILNEFKTFRKLIEQQVMQERWKKLNLSQKYFSMQYYNNQLSKNQNFKVNIKQKGSVQQLNHFNSQLKTIKQSNNYGFLNKNPIYYFNNKGQFPHNMQRQQQKMIEKERSKLPQKLKTKQQFNNIFEDHQIKESFHHSSKIRLNSSSTLSNNHIILYKNQKYNK